VGCHSDFQGFELQDQDRVIPILVLPGFYMAVDLGSARKHLPPFNTHRFRKSQTEDFPFTHHPRVEVRFQHREHLRSSAKVEVLPRRRMTGRRARWIQRQAKEEGDPSRA
jgi:hypothetical protein